jgi:hypothetical protein
MMDSMAGAESPRAGRKTAAACALLYAFVLLAAGFSHHDATCHRKSSTHCTSCVFSQGSAGIAATVPQPFLPAPRPVPITLSLENPASSVPLFFGTDSSPPAFLTV